MQTMKKALLNMESLFVMLAKENKARSLHIARKIQVMERAAVDRAEALRRDHGRKLGDVATNLERLRTEVDANREVAATGDEVVTRKLGKQLAGLEQRLSRYALDTELRSWTNERIWEAAGPLQKHIDTNEHLFWEKLDRLVKDNLVVPALIGEDDTCRYKNMAAYVQGRRVELTEGLAELKKSVETKAATALSQLQSKFERSTIQGKVDGALILKQ